MRLAIVPFGLLLVAPILLIVVPSSTNAAAFIATSPHTSWRASSRPVSSSHSPTRATDNDDTCGCASSPSTSAPVVVSGSPSELARAIDVRGALSSSSTTDVYRLDGSALSSSTSSSALLGPSDGTSLVVLTRSFG